MRPLLMRQKRLRENLPAILSAVIPGLFALSHQLSFAPVTEGWWHVYAFWLREGRTPYADFELLTGPLYPLVLLVLMSIGLGDFFALRIVGVLLTATLGYLIFRLVHNPSRPALSAVSAVTGGVFLQWGVAFIGYDYVYFALLFFLVAALHLRGAVVGTSQHPSRSLVMVGVFLALGAMTKHSLGFAIAPVVLAGIAIFGVPGGTASDKELSRFRPALLTAWGFLLGLIPILLWGALVGFLDEMARSLLASAAATKGGIYVLFERIAGLVFSFEIVRSARTLIFVLMCLLALLFGYKLVSLLVAWSIGRSTSEPIISSALFAVLLAGVFTSIASISSANPASFWRDVGFSTSVLVPIATLGLVIAKRINRSFVAPALISLGLASGSVLSAGIGELSVFLSLALALQLVFLFFGAKPFQALVAIPLVFSVIFFGAKEKFSFPYQWWGVTEEYGGLTGDRLQHGLSARLFVSSTTLERENEIRNALSKNSNCDGEIIAFPHMPKYVIDAGNLPGGRLGNYWFDFSSADAIDDEIIRLRTTPICGLVLAYPPDFAWEGHQQLFFGTSTSHEDLYNFLVLRADSMSEEASLELTDGWTVKVFVDG